MEQICLKDVPSPVTEQGQGTYSNPCSPRFDHGGPTNIIMGLSLWCLLLVSPDVTPDTTPEFIDNTHTFSHMDQIFPPIN